MTLKEFIQQLVETDDKMMRMSLVEENAGLMETTEIDTSAFDTQIAELQQNLSDAQTALAAANDKYIKTFFGGTEEQTEEETSEEDKTPSLDEVADSFTKNK